MTRSVGSWTLSSSSSKPAAPPSRVAALVLGSALMPLLVVGSIALDSVETPFGIVDGALGGSATFFSYAASFFTPVRLVGVVGEDFPGEHRRMLAGRGMDTAG